MITCLEINQKKLGKPDENGIMVILKLHLLKDGLDKYEQTLLTLYLAEGSVTVGTYQKSVICKDPTKRLKTEVPDSCVLSWPETGSTVSLLLPGH